ncbi:MAG: isoamylase early set domain-containing protein [Caldilineaceae bacterium]
MIYKQKSILPGYVHVIFELPACLWADRIHLVGEFCDWDHERLPLQQDRDGVWRIELDLPSGQRYEFRYRVDDRWLTDSHADELTMNVYGTQNSVVYTTLPVEQLQEEEHIPLQMPIPSALWAREYKNGHIHKVRKSALPVVGR